jgi:hypothetical protein
MGFPNLVNKTKIDEKYNTLIQLVKDTFGEDSDRTQNLLKFYADFEERVKTAPASGRVNFHNAYEGGYLDHILHVVECATMLKKMYAHLKGWIDFTDAELVFVALHHDINKLGTLEDPYYVEQDSQWHRTNRLEHYKINDEVRYMSSADAALFYMQKYGVTMSEKEFLALRLSHGMYSEGNKEYLKQYNAGFYPIRTNLHNIIHWADHMAACIEGDDTKRKAIE